MQNNLQSSEKLGRGSKEKSSFLYRINTTDASINKETKQFKKSGNTMLIKYEDRGNNSARFLEKQNAESNNKSNNAILCSPGSRHGVGRNYKKYSIETSKIPKPCQVLSGKQSGRAVFP